MVELVRKGAIEKLITAGATIRTAFCGPCFGAGDTPSHGGLSIRHTTRNFPNREDSKPGNGQIASVALMDARSIAASSMNGGRITAADELGYDFECPEYHYDPKAYQQRVYQGFGKGNLKEPLICGPNIKDWPELPPLNDHMLLKVCVYITDPVTTTDELIPSGETGSFRSNLINWGMVPFVLNGSADFQNDDYIFVPGIREILDGDMKEITAYVIGETIKTLSLAIEPLTEEEKEIIRCGSLINYNRGRKEK